MKLEEGFIIECERTGRQKEITNDVVRSLLTLWVKFQTSYQGNQFTDANRCLESLLLCTGRVVLSPKYTKKISQGMKNELKEKIKLCQSFNGTSDCRKIMEGIPNLLDTPWQSAEFNAVMINLGNPDSVLCVPDPDVTNKLWDREGWAMLDVRSDYLSGLPKAVNRFSMLLHILVTKGHQIHQNEIKDEPGVDVSGNILDPYKIPLRRYHEYLQVYSILIFKKSIGGQNLLNWNANLLLLVIECLQEKSKSSQSENLLFPKFSGWKETRETALFLAKTATLNALKSRDAIMLEEFYRKWSDLFKKVNQNNTDISKHHEKSPLKEILDNVKDAPCTETLYRIAIAASAMNDEEQNYDFRSDYMELFIQALTKDLNMLEELKTKTTQPNEIEKIREMEKNISSRYIELSDFFGRHPKTARDCLLTAFSLNPSEVLFNRIFPGTSENVNETCKQNEGNQLESFEIKPMQLESLDLNSEEDLQLPSEICDDLDNVIQNPRYKGFCRWTSNEEQRNLCIKLLENKTVDVIENRSLDFLEVDYEKYKDLKPQYDPEDDGIQVAYKRSAYQKLQREKNPLFVSNNLKTVKSAIVRQQGAAKSQHSGKGGNRNGLIHGSIRSSKQLTSKDSEGSSSVLLPNIRLENNVWYPSDNVMVNLMENAHVETFAKLVKPFGPPLNEKKGGRNRNIHSEDDSLRSIQFPSLLSMYAPMEQGGGTNVNVVGNSACDTQSFSAGVQPPESLPDSENIGAHETANQPDTGPEGGHSVPSNGTSDTATLAEVHLTRSFSDPLTINSGDPFPRDASTENSFRLLIQQKFAKARIVGPFVTRRQTEPAALVEVGIPPPKKKRRTDKEKRDSKEGSKTTTETKSIEKKPKGRPRKVIYSKKSLGVDSTKNDLAAEFQIKSEDTIGEVDNEAVENSEPPIIEEDHAPLPDPVQEPEVIPCGPFQIMRTYSKVDQEQESSTPPEQTLQGAAPVPQSSVALGPGPVKQQRKRKSADTPSRDQVEMKETVVRSVSCKSDQSPSLPIYVTNPPRPNPKTSSLPAVNNTAFQSAFQTLPSPAENVTPKPLKAYGSSNKKRRLVITSNLNWGSSAKSDIEPAPANANDSQSSTYCASESAIPTSDHHNEYNDSLSAQVGFKDGYMTPISVNISEGTAGEKISSCAETNIVSSSSCVLPSAFPSNPFVPCSNSTVTEPSSEDSTNLDNSKILQQQQLSIAIHNYPSVDLSKKQSCSDDVNVNTSMYVKAEDLVGFEQLEPCENDRDISVITTIESSVPHRNQSVIPIPEDKEEVESSTDVIQGENSNLQTNVAFGIGDPTIVSNDDGYVPQPEAVSKKSGDDGSSPYGDAVTVIVAKSVEAIEDPGSALRADDKSTLPSSVATDISMNSLPEDSVPSPASDSCSSASSENSNKLDKRGNRNKSSGSVSLRFPLFGDLRILASKISKKEVKIDTPEHCKTSNQLETSVGCSNPTTSVNGVSEATEPICDTPAPTTDSETDKNVAETLAAVAEKSNHKTEASDEVNNEGGNIENATLNRTTQSVTLGKNIPSKDDVPVTVVDEDCDRTTEKELPANVADGSNTSELQLMPNPDEKSLERSKEVEKTLETLPSEVTASKRLLKFLDRCENRLTKDSSKNDVIRSTVECKEPPVESGADESVINNRKDGAYAINDARHDVNVTVANTPQSETSSIVPPSVDDTLSESLPGPSIRLADCGPDSRMTAHTPDSDENLRKHEDACLQDAQLESASVEVPQNISRNVEQLRSTSAPCYAEFEDNEQPSEEIHVGTNSPEPVLIDTEVTNENSKLETSTEVRENVKKAVAVLHDATNADEETTEVSISLAVEDAFIQQHNDKFEDHPEEPNEVVQQCDDRKVELICLDESEDSDDDELQILTGADQSSHKDRDCDRASVSSKGSHNKTPRPPTPVETLEKILHDVERKRIVTGKDVKHKYEERIKVAPSVVKHVEEHGRGLTRISTCYVALKRIPDSQIPEDARSKLKTVKRSSRIKNRVNNHINSVLRNTNSNEDEDEEPEDEDNTNSSRRSSSPEIEILEEIPGKSRLGQGVPSSAKPVSDRTRISPDSIISIRNRSRKVVQTNIARKRGSGIPRPLSTRNTGKTVLISAKSDTAIINRNVTDAATSRINRSNFDQPSKDSSQTSLQINVHESRITRNRAHTMKTHVDKMNSKHLDPDFDPTDLSTSEDDNEDEGAEDSDRGRNTPPISHENYPVIAIPTSPEEVLIVEESDPLEVGIEMSEHVSAYQTYSPIPSFPMESIISSTNNSSYDEDSDDKDRDVYVSHDNDGIQTLPDSYLHTVLEAGNTKENIGAGSRDEIILPDQDFDRGTTSRVDFDNEEQSTYELDDNAGVVLMPAIPDQLSSSEDFQEAVYQAETTLLHSPSSAYLNPPSNHETHVFESDNDIITSALQIQVNDDDKNLVSSCEPQFNSDAVLNRSREDSVAQTGSEINTDIESSVPQPEMCTLNVADVDGDEKAFENPEVVSSPVGVDSTETVYECVAVENSIKSTFFTKDDHIHGDDLQTHNEAEMANNTLINLSSSESSSVREASENHDDQDSAGSFPVERDEANPNYQDDVPPYQSLEYDDDTISKNTSTKTLMIEAETNGDNDSVMAATPQEGEEELPLPLFSPDSALVRTEIVTENVDDVCLDRPPSCSPKAKGSNHERACEARDSSEEIESSPEFPLLTPENSEYQSLYNSDDDPPVLEIETH